jgi:hypothetical protein
LALLRPYFRRMPSIKGGPSELLRLVVERTVRYMDSVHHGNSRDHHYGLLFGVCQVRFIL